MHAGRLTPRHSLAALDDSATRPESPASSEGRNKKYRRSESERCVMSVKLGRMGSASNWMQQQPALKEDAAMGGS